MALNQSKDGRARRLAWRKLQIDAAKRCDPGTYGTREIPRSLFLFDRLMQDQPRLRFHGVVMFRSAHPQACLHVVVKVLRIVMFAMVQTLRFVREPN